jgi:hypothetical protein
MTGYRTDRRTDMTNQIVAFRNFSNPPKSSIRRKFTETFHRFIYWQFTAKIRSVQEKSFFKMTICRAILRVKRFKVAPRNVSLPFCITHTPICLGTYTATLTFVSDHVSKLRCFAKDNDVSLLRVRPLRTMNLHNWELRENTFSGMTLRHLTS